MYTNLSSEKRRSQEVATHLKELILDEKLKPGDKLPSELELCGLFSVSRPTIREAVKTLVSQGILDIHRGKGTYVSQMPGIAEDPLGLDFIMSPNLRLALIQARLIIEPGVARLAAQTADDRDIEKIAICVRDMEEIVYQHKVGINVELNFHRSIAEATKNPVIIRLIPIIMDSIVKTYKDAPRTSEDHRHAFEEHRIIYEAIAARDPERSFDAMHSHLDASYRRTITKQSTTSSFGTTQ
ncbi:MAG TPA: FadR family transcriptional regulator [Spirochaetaceae bacterium]|nr:FadR family transcriptional regulator [Spirochaetaceae bacterium]